MKRSKAYVRKRIKIFWNKRKYQFDSTTLDNFFLANTKCVE